MKCPKCGERLFDTLDGGTGCVVCDADNTTITSTRKMKVFQMNSDKDLEEYFQIARKLSEKKNKRNFR